MSVVLTPSWKKGKKLAALLSNDGEYITTVHFGDSAYSDYTQHKDRNRMKRYIARHEPKSDIGFRSEDWNYTGILLQDFGLDGYYGINHRLLIQYWILKSDLS